MNPLIKWPGGKSGEIARIEHIIPEYDRYIEPFFGGGALFFHLRPHKAAVNDISKLLTEYYKLVKAQDKEFYDLLLCYKDSFSNIIAVCDRHYNDILGIYRSLETKKLDKTGLEDKLTSVTSGLADDINYGFTERLLLDKNEFINHIIKMVADRMQRTVINNKKSPFSGTDLKSNLITGFTSGYYMYFRKVYNDINLNKIKTPSIQYTAANFYFIREYCYGSMFRYNSRGEFNIPYGGMSYNAKNFKVKIDNMFSEEAEAIFINTDIYCLDFEVFLDEVKPAENDFIFLDPPYDTDFSDYEGKDFTAKDHERLAALLQKTPAKFMLVIKNTEFIYNLYKNNFNILSFDNQYTYNVRSRNTRSVEHLIISNILV